MNRRKFFSNLLTAGAGALILPGYTATPAPELIKPIEPILEPNKLIIDQEASPMGPILQFYNNWDLKMTINTPVYDLHSADGRSFNDGFSSTAIVLEVWDAFGVDLGYIHKAFVDRQKLPIWLHRMDGLVYEGEYYITDYEITAEVENYAKYNFAFVACGPVLVSDDIGEPDTSFMRSLYIK